ncbi:MAG: response regulator [Candidatus Falkowbacteria bacterium]|nr:response regulator [Candidatus Falkowbacteria bacterium]
MAKTKTVLIVEDEQAMLDALANKLTKNGFAVLCAHDGEEGYNMAMAEKPDLLILDIIMPKINGMDLMAKIRGESGWGEAVPIIMLTNISDPENISRAAEKKVFDFLVKTDWRLDDVVKLVEEKTKDKRP